ncbi:MAG: helix-turn-helix transcriptional regulator [Roseburia sp.]|nr:helix-turn-helix transcriptional regulator [Roseburia sp.]
MEHKIVWEIVEFCVLYQFLTNDYSGYDILIKMRTLFPDINGGMFYSVLRKLHTKGFIEIYFNSHQEKKYKLTKIGESHLIISINNWRHVKEIARKIGVD